MSIDTKLVAVLLLGHWLEMRVVRGTAGALKELTKLIPPMANRIAEDGNIEEVPTSEVHRGDLLLVRPGEKVPKVVAMVGDGINDAPAWCRPTWALPSALAPTWQ